MQAQKEWVPHYCKKQPIAYASKALTKSQQNYAQIEKEMLAMDAYLASDIMTIQKYPLSVKYKPGKELVEADTLSRAYISEEASDLCSEDFEVNVIYTLPI